MQTYPSLPSIPRFTYPWFLEDEPRAARVGAEIANLLGGCVDYDVLRAANEGDLFTVQQEVWRLRRIIERAERLLSVGGGKS